MWKPGIWELVIILVIVLLIFGVGRLGKLGRELGQGISEFRKGIGSNKEEESTPEEAVKKEEKSE
jgi:sec-independent protein translocase protein TatA